MASEAQIQANRENAKHSTGPRSLEGKERVALNALKHGLTGKQVVLYNEEPEAFDAFREALWEDLDPQGTLEGVLVDKIVADAWRLRRVPLLEATMHACIRGERQLGLVRDGLSVLSRMTDPKTREQGAVRIHPDDKEKFLELDAARKELESNTYGASFEVARTLRFQPQHFNNLSQREEALARSMLRTLHELERLQRRRAGETLAAPAVVNVELDVNHNGGDGSAS